MSAHKGADLLSMAKSLHISISPDTLFTIGGLPITNTLFTSFLLTAVLLIFLFIANRKLKQTNKPAGLQNVLEMIVDGIYGLVDGGTNGHKALTDAFVPLIGSFIIFIIANNWVALLPGFHTISYTGEPTIKIVQVPSWMKMPQAFASTTPAEVEEITSDEDAGDHGEAQTSTEEDHGAAVTEEHSEEANGEEHAAEAEHHGVELFRGANSDVNNTIALALISVAATQYFGLKFAHLGYLKKFFNLSSPLMFMIGLLELVLELAKVISFGFRLFGNIFAGGVLLSVMSFLLPIILPVPFIGLELFVGALQAYVFAMLSLVFFNMAASEHH